MERLNAGKLVATAHSLVCTSSLGTDDQAPLKNSWRAIILDNFQSLLAECEKLGLLVPSQYCKDAINVLENYPGQQGETGAISRMTAMVVNSIQIEMSERVYFALSPDRNRFYEPTSPLLGKEFEDKFPSAAFDADEAGKCLALGRYTASVFHFMRVMELAVKASARCLGIPDPIRPAGRNWGHILGEIKKGIDAKWPGQSSRHGGDGALFESLYASLDAVRNPWRNPQCTWRADIRSMRLSTYLSQSGASQ